MDKDVVKLGANYLLRGGTLLSEPCKECGNLQVQYKGDILCINCHKSINQSPQKNISENNLNPNIDKDTSHGSKDVDLGINNEEPEILKEIEEGVLTFLRNLYHEFISEENVKTKENHLKVIHTCLRVIERLNRIKTG